MTLLQRPDPADGMGLPGSFAAPAKVINKLRTMLRYSNIRVHALEM